MELTDVIYYSLSKKKRLKARDCPILSTFLFSRHDFYVVDRKGNFDFCILKDGELYSLCRCIKKGTTLSEAMSKFRSGFLKNNITDDKINSYLEAPEEYLSKEKSSKKKKNKNNAPSKKNA